MMRNKVLGVPSQRVAKIMLKVLNDAVSPHAQRRHFSFNRQRVLNKKRLGMNDDSPMIRNLNLFDSYGLYQPASQAAPQAHPLLWLTPTSRSTP